MTITASLTQQVWTLLRENTSCWIQQPKRDKASAAPYAQVQPAVRLKTYDQQAYAHRAYIYTTYIHGWPHRSASPVADTWFHSLRVLQSLAPRHMGPLEDRTDCADHAQGMARQAHRPASYLHQTSPFYPLIFSHTGCSPNHLNLSFSPPLIPPLNTP